MLLDVNGVRVLLSSVKSSTRRGIAASAIRQRLSCQQARRIRLSMAQSYGRVLLKDYEEACLGEGEERAWSLEARVRQSVEVPPDLAGPDKSTAGEPGGYSGRCRWPLVIALDVAYSKHRTDTAVASGVLYCVADGKATAEYTIVGQPKFPYRPGLLAFREVPLLTAVVEHLLARSDESSQHVDQRIILLCDGHGIAHPRHCGVACHLGVLFGLPSVGVAKSHFVGISSGSSVCGDDGAANKDNVQLKDAQSADVNDRADPSHDRNALIAQLGHRRGSMLWLTVNDRSDAGAVLRTQDGVRPLYLSAGHRISTAEAASVVLALCIHGVRQPQPIRLADHLGRAVLRQHEGR